MANADKGEIAKLQQHLALLKEQYVKLQTHCNELERKYALAAAAAGDINENSFVAKLLKTVAELFDQELYSDMKVKLNGQLIPAHRFVLAARSERWGVPSLADVDSLDWSDLVPEVGAAMLKWVYTDQVDFSRGDTFTLDLMRTANTYKLEDLVAKCEKALMASVNVRNCVRYYTTADEIGAETLKQHCSGLISAHWDDFTSEDFAHMSAPLLFRMFKSKTGFPLHAAVRLQREDVVFLYLVENNAELSTLVNQLDGRGELALDIALCAEQSSIARTLVEHQADLNARDMRGYTLLHRAVERGDGFSASFLIGHGASVATVTPELGDTALHMIASYSPTTSETDVMTAMTEVARQMLEKGLDPNLQNKQGFTPLHLSVMAQNESVFSLLLSRTSQPVDLNLRTEEGHTALWFALLTSLEYGEESFAAQLIKKGASPNPIYSFSADSLLHLVCKEGLEEAGLFLCTHGTNPNHVNKKGESPLHVACAKGLNKLVTALLKSGANPNLQTLQVDDRNYKGIGDTDSLAYRQTPLHVAIFEKQEGAIKAIIQHKKSEEPKSIPVDFNLKDSSGSTPLALALVTGMQHMVAELIRGGADVNVRNGKGLTLLHQAIMKEDSETSIFLLDQGADMNAVTTDNETPLQLGIKCQLPDVVDALCRRGVDMSVLDANNNCPLWVALESGQENIASILVRNGVDTDCWGEGPEGCYQTLLHKAIDENNEPIARFLIQSGCDLNSARKPGPGGRGGDEARDQASPLHHCCQWGLETVVQTLVEHGAAINSRDAEGKTPLHVAIQNQHSAIITLLLCHPGIDLSIRDKSGLTPFATALTYRNNKAAQAILDKLPTAAEQYDNKGRNFLHMAIQKNDMESVLFLLSIHVDVNSRVQDATQTPPLHLAAASGSEMLVRSLLLAGARADDRDAHRRTALHVAAAAGHASVVSALLQNGANFDATDSEGDNALHIATCEGHLPVARALLTESRLDAEAINIKGRNPLHVLARYSRDNAAAICELFIECMPEYPLDKPDLEGNTALLLAYMKGNGNLCRTLVKAGACLGAMNKDGVTIFNYQVATKQLLYRLLDHLSQEPPWAEGDICLECGAKFGLTMRKHHCRHCGRILCSKCSDRDVPILKFGLNKPVRVCMVCFDVLQVGSA
ncbi:rabankyrin-5 [Periplaneta americana]|uniref:rabankyrin-5 n=1 Tax=Periplaneta americana TaxID=6978 RepID=UPI0037E8F7ED